MMKLAMSDLGILSMQCPKSWCILAVKENFALLGLMLLWFGFQMANCLNAKQPEGLWTSYGWPWQCFWR